MYSEAVGAFDPAAMVVSIVGVACVAQRSLLRSLLRVLCCLLPDLSPAPARHPPGAPLQASPASRAAHRGR